MSRKILLKQKKINIFLVFEKKIDKKCYLIQICIHFDFEKKHRKYCEKSFIIDWQSNLSLQHFREVSRQPFTISQMIIHFLNKCIYIFDFFYFIFFIYIQKPRGTPSLY